MRTAGIDLSLASVVLCSLPIEGDGIGGEIWSVAHGSRDPRLDLADRMRQLTGATRECFQRAAGTDVASVCIEVPGVIHKGAGMKLMAAFGAVCAGVPHDVPVSSMLASEWKKQLKLPQNKQKAHEEWQSRHGIDLTHLSPDDVDAWLVALAWRKMQQDAEIV